ncbi:MAG TPA: ketoacyl-ACP synthase III [Myxococcales bacterium]|nr:ketoacyl-ACP synthase III [Myxococcales bacterium]
MPATAIRAIPEIELQAGPNIFRCATRLVSIAGWAPPRRLTTLELERTLAESGRLPALSVADRTGVLERRVSDQGLDILDMALEASRKALAQAEAHGISVADLDLLIYCGVCRQYLEPATATVLHGMLGLQRATAFDISDACLGFIDGWMVADAMIATGRARRALVVSAEAGTHYGRLSMEAMLQGGDPRVHFASLTLGDGAAAAVIASRDGRPDGFLRGLRETHGEHHGLCIIPRAGEPMTSHASRLLSVGLRHFEENARAVIQASGWTVDDVDLVVPHQASSTVIERGREALGISPDKVAVTLDRFGNMASVAVPFTLAQAVEEERVGKGSRVLITGFGSGLGVGMLSLQM